MNALIRMTLFPEPPAPSTSPLRHRDPHVVWLQQSTRPEAVADRQRINAWYADFPDSLGHMATKLHSRVNDTFHSTLDEVYVHHLLRGVERDVRYEEGGQGEPDFRVYRGGSELLVAEVVSLFMREDWAAEQRRHDELSDFLNSRLEPTGYRLHVEIGVQNQNIPMAKLEAFTRGFLDSLPDPTVARAAYQAGDPLEFDDFVCSGVHVRLHAWPMSLTAASSVTPGTRIVGMGPAIGGLVNSHARLKKRLEKKRAKPYRLSPGVPFIIVVSNHDIFCEGSELMQAIFGWDWERVGTGEARMHPNPAYGGFFGIGVPGERPRHRLR